MSMNVNLHTKHSEKFTVKSELQSNKYTKNYVVFRIGAKPVGSYEYDEVTVFSSYDQAKQMHKELSKLMKEIAAIEKAEKVERMAELIQQHQ